MDKSKLNYLIDFLMGLVFIVLAVIGLILFVFLPRGISKGGYQVFLGISKNYWIFVHEWLGIVLIALVIIHLILHWEWIIKMTKNLFHKK